MGFAAGVVSKTDKKISREELLFSFGCFTCEFGPGAGPSTGSSVPNPAREAGTHSSEAPRVGRGRAAGGNGPCWT